MKTTISPSILGGSFSNMEKTISELDVSNAEYIHFDVMDGDFVPNLTFGPQFISDLRLKTKKIFDVHLMIHRVGKFLDDYIKAGSDIITFHYEINENINDISCFDLFFLKIFFKILKISSNTKKFINTVKRYSILIWLNDIASIDNKIIEVNAKKNLTIRDLTGAGDLFAAGYLHGYINNLSNEKCLEEGVELSSKVIQQIGARL